MSYTLLLLAVFLLAYANGANDNFKGVATLYGSGTASFRRALRWATASTITGSILSIVLAGSLAKAFTGYGLVPPEMSTSPALLTAVGSGAAITVLLATWLGMPTSTTHALTGALIGISLWVNGGSAPLGKLWSGFMQPLLLSPVLAIGGAWLLYSALHRFRVRQGIARQTCLCVGTALVPISAKIEATAGSAAAILGPSAVPGVDAGAGLRVILGTTERCVSGTTAVL